MSSFITRSFVAFAAGAALVLVPASTAYAQAPLNPLLDGDDEQAIRTLPGLAEYDVASSWTQWMDEIDYEDGECIRHDVGRGTYTMPGFPGRFEDWVVAIVKSVGDEAMPASNDLTWWPIPGEVFWHSSEQDIAHVILCSADFSDDDGVVPPPPVTTTTTPTATPTTSPTTTPTTSPTTTPTGTPTTPPVQDFITRIGGADRYDTARLISSSYFDTGVPVVYLTTGTTFPDALAVAALAAAGPGPILLTQPDYLPAEPSAELQRLDPAQVIILGGTGAVSTTVEQAVAALGIPVSRIGGGDRYETAALISSTLQPSAGQTDRVYVATGLDFPDALVAAAVAARDGSPLLLTGPQLPPVTRAELIRLNPSEVIILGATGAVSDAVESSVLEALPSVQIQRLGGSDRFDTAARIVAAMFPANRGGAVYIATGTDFPDSLAVSPVAGLRQDPVLIVRPTGPIPPVVMDELRRLAPERLVILGSLGAVSAEVEAELATLAP